MVTIGGTLVGRYRIDDVLGSGGMASVFRAHDERLGRDVAVKVLFPHLTSDPAIVTRFEREARALAAIRHPNVIGVFDVEAGDDVHGRPPFLVLELADGGTLADRLRAHGALASDAVAALVGQVAAGLAAIHEAGLVHRDVKPANVLFVGDTAKVGDLGVARRLGPGPGSADPSLLTTDGAIVGTMRYLAPEALAGDLAGPAVDTFGLAATAFEALTGRPLRQGSSLMELAAGAGAPAPIVSEVAPGLGPRFDAILAAGLDPDPARRPTPEAFASRLADAEGQALPVATPPDPGGATIVRAEGRPSSMAMALPAAARTDSTVRLAVPPRRAPSPRSADGWTPRSRAAAAAPAAVSPATRGRDRSTRRRVEALAVPALFAGAAVLVGAALLVTLGGIGSTDRPVDQTPLLPSPVVSIAPSASASASPSPSPTPTALPTPSPTTDPATAAIDDVRAAIAAARGGGGLKGGDAKGLDDRVDRIAVELGNGHRTTARELAQELVDRVGSLTDHGKLDDARASRLRDTAAALLAALGGD